jgi:tRNA dimethylallyltransferase
MSDKTVIVIAGPTAIGKTELAIRVARHFKTEIVSADSRQFYREMSIGTAKPSEEELSAAKHHFINSHSVHDEFSVGEFERASLSVIQEIFTKNPVAVVTGGSGLYIKAITEGFDDLPKADPDVRSELNLRIESEGIESLQAQLKELDPTYYDEVDLGNPQRVIRALEVCITSGKPFSSFRSNISKERPFNIIKIGINTSRETLYKRINDRVDKMVNSGLIDEVKGLMPFRHLNALNTVGYSEIFEALDGETMLETAIESIKQNTRRFAKRQLTWFRKDTEIEWFEPDQLQEILKYLDLKIQA